MAGMVRAARHVHLLPWLGLLLLACCGERGASPRRRPAPDAAMRRPPWRDAAPPVSPRTVSHMDLGFGCACEGLPAQVTSTHLAARRAAVARMDALNDELRGFIEALDAAAGSKDSMLPDPAPHARRLDGIRCRLDCLLHQFLGFSRPAWAYLGQVARFLDRAAPALARLSLPPEARPAGPGAAELTDAFNEVARLSNHSIGLALLAPPKPALRQDLDSLAFGAKSRRLALAVAEVLITHLQTWIQEPGAAPLPRVGAEPAACRVALARLRQELSAKVRDGQALGCDRGAACASLAARWAEAVKALQELGVATRQVDNALREAGGRPLAGGTLEASWKPVAHAKQAWEVARAALSGSR